MRGSPSSCWLQPHALTLPFPCHGRPDPEEVRLFGKATIQLHKHTKEQWDAVQNDSFLAGADFKQVWYYIPIHTVKQWNKRRADDCLPEGPDDPAIPADVRVCPRTFSTQQRAALCAATQHRQLCCTRHNR